MVAGRYSNWYATRNVLPGLDRFVTRSAQQNQVGMLVVGLVIGGAVVAALLRPSPSPKEPELSPPVIAAQPSTLPPGHPPLAGGGAQNPHAGGMPSIGAEKPEASVTWVVPKRWLVVPHPSPMRLVTYRVPRATGDAEDAELSVTRAGGDVQANADRWIGQFDAEGQKTGKKTSRKIAGLNVVVVEVKGAYQGMSASAPQAGFMLLGAIVETAGEAHFFKLTGPEKSVEAARTELESLLTSLAPRT